MSFCVIWNASFCHIYLPCAFVSLCFVWNLSLVYFPAAVTLCHWNVSFSYFILLQCLCILNMPAMFFVSCYCLKCVTLLFCSKAVFFHVVWKCQLIFFICFCNVSACYHSLSFQKVCVRQAVFSLLARMRHGLYYNMPLVGTLVQHSGI